ncbi:hypothetical protein SAMN05216199_1671 [Pedococcus cremeus]|uniref:Uncharacterized protein n=1 Tax=Pedococcus cremeus TaxID=587636 RepID=A0A1H9TM67_9MICO|nr:hypothetical protein [Pedococcus cremeus]SER98211.1 hypothetical protein SAMN05216199_1671 [Pedococcus cremeus]
MPETTSHLRPDGTTFPPVTPDPPPPPGYVDPLAALEGDALFAGAAPPDGDATSSGSGG